jgi:hypothetical protein
MGQELECKARIQRGALIQGRAQLETDFVLFRGPERFKVTRAKRSAARSSSRPALGSAPHPLRFKVSFGELTGVKADGGVLKLEFAGGPAELELGAAAEKWARKILNPPSLLDKLGVKAGLTVRLIGGFEEFEPGFRKQIAERKAVAVANGKCDLLFLAAPRSRELDRIGKLKASLQAGGALWVIYPKGVSQIKEIEVIQAGRAAGMKDVKVARFSATHTGLKFV